MLGSAPPAQPPRFSIHPSAALLGSPATWLLLVSVLFTRAAQWPGVLRSWAPVAVVTTAFLVLGALLTATRQAAELGRAAATLGIAYPAIAPWLGGLSGYLTGSNAGANARLRRHAEAAAGLGFRHHPWYRAERAQPADHGLAARWLWPRPSPGHRAAVSNHRAAAGVDAMRAGLPSRVLPLSALLPPS